MQIISPPALLQLSIIIVNYNVKYFLEQCLCSVKKAIENIEAEVFVVDNASGDGSIGYLQPNFDWVHFIANTNNPGFGAANNQALWLCKGKYVLFLNPDTILAEDTLRLCIQFMEEHAEAGGLGIRMVDGSGAFLPESKRSFPLPTTSFFKLVGLSRLFPKSKLFARYALGYLDQHENHEVDVLAGAFLLSRRELLVELNGFDEAFFMYGEDIDLSYRLQQLGYKNYYFSQSSIIHFKGESTRKGSLNYVRMFYQAMSIFVKKHYTGSSASLFRVFIQLAIRVRAFVAAIFTFFVKLGLPLLDAIVIFGSFKMADSFWVKYFRHGLNFNEGLVNVSLPGFTLLFLVSASLAGIYDNKYKPLKALYATFVATIIMLAVYSLLPERFRFSRGVILFGGLMALTFITFFRWILLKKGLVNDDDENNRQKQTLIVAGKEDYVEVLNLLTKANLQERVMGRIATNGNKTDAIGRLDELSALLSGLNIKEVVFCEGSLSYKQIIAEIHRLPSTVNVRFHSRGSHSIVGSDSKNTSGETVALEANYAIVQPNQKRMKRIVDVATGLFILITFPVHLVLFGSRMIANAVAVLGGKKTWIGYSYSGNLPIIPLGVLSTSGVPIKEVTPTNLPAAIQVDNWYARHYDWTMDVKLIVKHYKKLGGKV